MNRYWKRLKNHPGVPIASFLTVAFCFAGMGRDDASLAQGALIGLVTSLFVWAIVLWTARTQPLPKEQEHE